MRDFALHRPASVADAAAAFATGGEAAYLAGGHTLIPAMKSRLRMPDALIDLSALGLNGVAQEGDRLWIGAMTRHADVASGATASGTSTKVLIQKHPVLIVNSQTSSTQGDEAGAHGGVVSHSTAGPAKHVQGSSKVIVEGKGAVLIGNPTTHNGSPANCTGNVVSTSNAMVLAAP